MCDLQAASSLCLQLHQLSAYSDIPFSYRKFEDLISKAVCNSDNMAFLIAERDCEVVGFLLAEIEDYFLGEQEMAASVRILSVDRNMLSPVMRAKCFCGLVEAAKFWSLSRGAGYLQISTSTGLFSQAPDRLLQACGARRIGGNFMI